MSILFGGLILELVVDTYGRGCVIVGDVVAGAYLRALVVLVVSFFCSLCIVCAPYASSVGVIGYIFGL